jgi:hypothetical protein
MAGRIIGAKLVVEGTHPPDLSACLLQSVAHSNLQAYSPLKD